MGHGRRYPKGWSRFRRYILDRDGWRCAACSRPGKLEVSHIVAVHVDPSRELDPDNVRVLCRACHLKADRQAHITGDAGMAGIGARYVRIE